MHIHHIATRFTDRPHHQPGDLPIAHDYRRRWWLPVIGPTATVLLDHLTPDTSTGWTVHDTIELGTALGLGQRIGIQSPLIRTFDRLTRFGFGSFDVEPADPTSDPCITLRTTIGLVPERFTSTWPQPMQQAHAIDLAALHRAAA